MSPLVPNGKATRSTSLRRWNGEVEGLVPSQVTERFQARDLTLYGPPNPPASWASVVWLAGIVCVIGLCAVAFLGNL